MKKLVIVESPSKAKTISNFLKDTNVIASKGHIRDLSIINMGIQIDYDKKTFTPNYEIDKGHKSIVNEIKALAKNAEVYLATDEDREGEAISWHLTQILGGDPLSYKRIVFHEITKSAILKAIENPRKLNLNDVNSQQARRMLDRIIGFKLSSYINKKIPGKLSVGRVQSAALKLIVERENKIQEFIPLTYYEFNTIFRTDLKAEYTNFKKQELINKEQAEQLYKSILSDKYKISNLENKSRNSRPNPPFMTSSLQQTASTVLGFDPKKTMEIAQKLYEGVDTPDGLKGVITYMRTDSLNLAIEAVEACRNFILNTHGKDYLPNEPRSYVSKAKGAQEAHEAIRVTDISFTPEIAKKYLEQDQLKLYTLIYNRFIACQMSDAVFNNTNVYINGENGNNFKISGRILTFPGHLLYPVGKSNTDDILLPSDLTVGREMILQNCKLEEKQTEPPARYNEASLVKAMEESGIGRPSTYASIISLIVTRRYVEKLDKALKPTEAAYKIVNFLDKNFSAITDITFTSNMEENLDRIAHGEIDYNTLLADYWFPINEKLKKDDIPSEKLKILANKKCPKCGKELLIRKSKFGKDFIGCEGYPKCKYIEGNENNIPKEKTIIGVKPCPKCKNGTLVERQGRGNKFLGCSNYPKCKHNEKIEPNVNE